MTNLGFKVLENHASIFGGKGHDSSDVVGLLRAEAFQTVQKLARTGALVTQKRGEPITPDGGFFRRRVVHSRDGTKNPAPRLKRDVIEIRRRHVVEVPEVEARGLLRWLGREARGIDEIDRIACLLLSC